MWYNIITNKCKKEVFSLGLLSSISKALSSVSKSISSKSSSSSSSSSGSSSSSKSSSSGSSSSSSGSSNSSLPHDVYRDSDGVLRVRNTSAGSGYVSTPGSIKSDGYGVYAGPVDPNSIYGSGYTSALWKPGPNNIYNYSVDAGGRYDMNKDYASLIQSEQNPVLRNQYIAERNNKIEAMKASGTWKDSYETNNPLFTPNYDLYDRNTNGYVGANSPYTKYDDDYKAIYGTYENPTPFNAVAYNAILKRQKEQNAYSNSVVKSMSPYQNIQNPVVQNPIVQNPVTPTATPADTATNYFNRDTDNINNAQRNLISDNFNRSGGQGAQIKGTSGAISRYLADDVFKNKAING